MLMRDCFIVKRYNQEFSILFNKKRYSLTAVFYTYLSKNINNGCSSGFF